MAAARVPTEIWSQIFHNSLEQHVPRMHPNHTPIIFTRVCRRWREIALAIPRLWTVLRLPAAPYTRDATVQKSFIDAIASWLRYSGNLRIARFEASELATLTQTYFEMFVDAFIPHSCRIERLSLSLEQQHIGNFPKVAEHAFPVLRRFNFHTLSGHCPSRLLRALPGATNLRTVSLDSPTLFHREWAYDLPQLRNLTLDVSTTKKTNSKQAVNTDIFVDIISSLPDLEELTVSFGPWASDPSRYLLIQSTEVIQFSWFWALHLFMTPKLLAAFTNVLELSELDKLSINTRNRLWDPWWNDFMAFTHHFSSSLHDLSLTNVRMNTQQLTQLLSEFPNLDVLELTELSGIEDWAIIFDSLTLRFDEHERFVAGSHTQLEELILDRRQGWTSIWAYDELVAMLASRRRECLDTRLAEFNWLITDSEKMSKVAPTAFTELCALAEAGMIVRTLRDGNVDGNDSEPEDSETSSSESDDESEQAGDEL